MNRDVYNLANALTLSRLLLLIPLAFLILNRLYFWSFLVAVLMLLTDWFDDYYARKHKTHSDFGVFLDFIVDQSVFAAGFTLLLFVKNKLNPLTIIYVLVFLLMMFTMLLIRKNKKLERVALIHKWVGSIFLFTGLFLLVDIDFLFYLFLYASLLIMIVLIIPYNYLNLFIL